MVRNHVELLVHFINGEECRGNLYTVHIHILFIYLIKGWLI